MGLNAIKNAINTIIKSNADGINVIKDGVNVSIGEVRCIYEGKTISIWKKNKYYYLTFYANSGTGTMSNQTMPCGTVAALSANLFSRIGYLFQGWNTDADGDAVYTDGQEVADIAGAGETLTLYAIWKAITWYVKFHANGGSGSMANQAHAYDTELALTENAFTRVNYTFLGWGTTQAGKVVYADQAVVKNLKTTHGATINLYAVWQHNGYYAVKDGSLVDCPNAATEQYGGHSGNSGALTSANGTKHWGAYGHTMGTAYWGATTGELETYGCSILSFTVHAHSSNALISSAKYYVYGDGVEIAQEDIGYYSYVETSATVDISAYSTVEVRVRISDNDTGANSWCGAGLVEVRIHN